MFNWANVLKQSPIDWLLEKANPSVRYFTLHDVLGKSEDHPQVVAAKRAVPGSSVVKKILMKQNPKGYWEEPLNPYHPKYKSSYWQIMMLAQLGMDKTDERVRKACEYIFQFQSAEGGFSSSTEDLALKEYEWFRRKGRKLPSAKEYATSIVHEHEYSCLTGNMAAALTRMGYGNDTQVLNALEWLVKTQNPDGGWLCPYWRAHVRDKHGCFFGTICPLEAFSEVRKENLTKEMRQAIQKGAEFMLMHRLFKADHHGYKTISKHWLTLGFPMFISYNILRGLDVLTRLGYVGDERLDDAVKVLLEKRQKNGAWLLEGSPTGRMQTNLEPKGKPSKWITLIALRTLNSLGSTPRHSARFEYH